MDALLAVLTHPLAEGNVAIRQNVLRVLPTLLQRCGGSLRSSLDRVIPFLAERLVDSDAQSRGHAVRVNPQRNPRPPRPSSSSCPQLSAAHPGRDTAAHPGRDTAAQARALHELFAVVRPAAAVGTLLAPNIFGKGVRVREMVLIFMCDALFQTRGSVHADELATACTAAKPLAALLKTLDDTVSPSCIATLGLLQRLHAVPAVAPRLRALLSSAANASGVPRSALRIASARLDDADRGIAPTVPRLETHAGFQTPRTPAAADRLPTTPGDTAAAASQLPPPPTARAAPKTPRSHSQLPQPRTPHQATCDGGMGHLAATTSRPPRKSLGGNKGVHGGEPSDMPVGPVRISSDELPREVREAARTLKLPLRADGTWEQRAAAMRRLEALLLGGCARHAQCAHLFNSLLREPLGLQLADLRSKCVKQACVVICEAARQMGGAYLESAEHMLPQLLKLAQVTVHVITESADACVCTLLREVRARSLLPPILHGAIGREGSAASLRAGCARYIELAISEFDTATLSAAEMTLLETALRHTLQDASSEVRAGARAAFAAFERQWPARAVGLKGLLQASTAAVLSTPASTASTASTASRADKPWKNKSKRFIQEEVQVFAPPRPPSPPPAEAPSPPPPQKTRQVVAAGEGGPARQAWAGSASPTHRPARPLGERGLSANASAGQPRAATRSCDGADADMDGHQREALRLPASAGERAAPPDDDEMFAEEYAEDGYAEDYGEGEEGAAEGDEHAFDEDDDDEHRGDEEYLAGYNDAPQDGSWPAGAEHDDGVNDGDGEEEHEHEDEYDDEDDGGGGFDTSLPAEGAWAMLPGEAHWAGQHGQEDNPLSRGSEAEWLRGYSDDGDGGADGGGYEEAEQLEGDGADVLGQTVRPSHAPAEAAAPAVQPARQPRHRSAPASPAARLAPPPSQSPAPSAADWPQQSPRRGRPPHAQPPQQRPSPSPRKPAAPPSPAAAAAAHPHRATTATTASGASSSEQAAEAARRARHESAAAREEAAAAQQAARHAEARAATVERQRATADEECAALRRRLQQAEARHQQAEAERRHDGDEAARALEAALERLHAAEQRAASAEQRAASVSAAAASSASAASASASVSRAQGAEEARLDAARAALAAREVELERREADAQAAQRQAAKRLADGRHAEQASTERVAEAARFAAELRERELELHRREQALSSSQAILHKREQAFAVQAAHATQAARAAAVHASTPNPNLLAEGGATSSVAKPPAASRPTPRTVPPFAVTPGALALEPAYDGGAAARTALSPLPLSLAPEGEPPGDISELLAACNAYVDNIVSENQRMRSKLLSCRSRVSSGPTHAPD